LTEIGPKTIPDEHFSTGGNLFLKLIAICVFLTLLITALYWQVTAYDFINLDDTTYVTENPLVKKGLTEEGISEAFSSVYAANWHPLTWLSHMLDLEFFGMNPGMHHLVNVIFHILNSLLLFLVLTQMTKTIWRSAAVAVLFAVHPLHVESVVWVAERKDVLSTFFWMLTMAGYVWYVKHSSIKAYCLTIICYVFGLISKPMLVTLPFVLMLLDFWPLQRWNIPQGEIPLREIPGKFSIANIYKDGLIGSAVEKLPLFLMAAASCGITLYAQKEAIKSFELFPWIMRISNAVVSYVTYLEKTIWPFHLSIFYPFHSLHPLHVALCATALILITLLGCIFKKKYPYLAAGWLWYLGTLIPVIGIVQVGGQSMADRYTYVPLIGIFIIFVWGLGDLFEQWDVGKKILLIISAVVLILLCVRTYHQIGLWKNSEILFIHALKNTQNNYIALYDLGISLEKRGDIKGAISYYEEALRINPRLYGAHNNLGALLVSTGKTNEGIQHFLAALQTNPHPADIYYNLGMVYYQNGNIPKAIEYFQKAVNENKNHKEAIYHLNEARKKSAKS
jgi:protein O-mannosyl-transferase